MKYTNINEEWEIYKETIKEPLADKRKIERIWREAYMRGFEVAKEGDKLPSDFKFDFTIPEDFYTNRAKYFVLLELNDRKEE
jgi:hypothetical protein